MPNSSSFLRQISEKEGYKSNSKRWGRKPNHNSNNNSFNDNARGYGESELNQVEGLNSSNNNNNNNNNGGFSGGGIVMRKRVMVVVDQKSNSKHAMIWALTHVTNKGDLLTLLHILSPNEVHECDPSYLANSLGSLCKASKPEVEIEALVIEGPKLPIILSQVKKLDVSVLVLGQQKSSSLLNCICGMMSREELVEECINNADCLTIGVRKQSKDMGGFLISTRWQKNFWLLA